MRVFVRALSLFCAVALIGSSITTTVTVLAQSANSATDLSQLIVSADALGDGWTLTDSSPDNSLSGFPPPPLAAWSTRFSQARLTADVVLERYADRPAALASAGLTDPSSFWGHGAGGLEPLSGYGDGTSYRIYPIGKGAAVGITFIDSNIVVLIRAEGFTSEDDANAVADQLASAEDALLQGGPTPAAAAAPAAALAPEPAAASAPIASTAPTAHDSGGGDYTANQIAAGDEFTLVSYTSNNRLPSSELVAFVNGGAAVAAGDNYNPNPLLDQLIPQMQAQRAGGLDAQQAVVQVWDTPDGKPPADFVPGWSGVGGPNVGDRAIREQILSEVQLQWASVSNPLLVNDPSKPSVLDPYMSDVYELRVAKGNLATRVLWQATNEVWGYAINLALAYDISDTKGGGNTPAGLANPAQGVGQSSAGLFDGGMRPTSMLDGGEVSNRYYLLRRYKTPQGIQVEVFLLPDALKQMNADMLTNDIVKAVTDARALGTVNRVQVVNSKLDMPDESKGPFQPYDSIKSVEKFSSATERTLAELDSKNGVFVLQPPANPQFYAALATVLTALNKQVHING